MFITMLYRYKIYYYFTHLAKYLKEKVRFMEIYELKLYMVKINICNVELYKIIN